eukprot:706816-Hanusia_phi.AAC.2
MSARSNSRSTENSVCGFVGSACDFCDCSDQKSDMTRLVSCKTHSLTFKQDWLPERDDLLQSNWPSADDDYRAFSPGRIVFR